MTDQSSAATAAPSVPRRTGRRLLIGAGFILSALAAVAVISVVDVIAYARRSDPGPAGAALVLGASVYLDRPSPVFTERIRHAVDLYRAGAVRFLVMTGGRGSGDRISEAEAARDWALSQGVPASAILVEGKSRTTQENLAFALPILRDNGITRVLLVSDPLHMRRAVGIARRLGIDAHPSPTPSTRFTGWRSWTGFLISEAYYGSRCRFLGRC